MLLDTAGIRDAQDQVERIGVERTIATATSSDIICFVIDPTKHDTSDFEIWIQEHTTKLINSIPQNSKSIQIIAFNKQDLWTKDIAQKVERHFSNGHQKHLNKVTCSAHHNELEELKKALERAYDALVGTGLESESPVLISRRQYDKATLAMTALEQALALTQKNDFPEKIASLLIETSQHLTDLVGEIGTEDVLSSIFSTFCIGK